MTESICTEGRQSAGKFLFQGGNIGGERNAIHESSGVEEHERKEKGRRLCSSRVTGRRDGRGREEYNRGNGDRALGSLEREDEWAFFPDEGEKSGAR